MRQSSVLAIRATNQYRRRDVLAYLGLRYYLDSSAARSDRWVREVATDQVLRRQDPCYLNVQHFKEADAQGRVTHRDMFLPGPNEALAEASLLEACAQTGAAFLPSSSVFSYRLANAGDLSGVYQHYVHGLRQRQEAIASACRRSPDAEVLHLDIRRFYPSVTIRRAMSAWLGATESQGMGRGWTEVGVCLLQSHARASATPEGHLLTGPLFSHLVGNLVLRSVDQAMSQLPVGYFRYVDDITLVGTGAQLENAQSKLKSLLDELGLSLHGRDSPKWLKVSAQTWLLGENDFAQQKRGDSWMSLIGDLKRLLVFAPELRQPLADELAAHELRLPLPDYASAVQERSYRSRLTQLLDAAWFRRLARKPSISQIVAQAMALRQQYEAEAWQLLDAMRGQEPFLTKRLLPKIRYRFGRLAYLGELSELGKLAGATQSLPALQFQSAVARSISTGDVNEIMGYGVNAAQAVAQPLSIRAQHVVIGKQSLDPIAQQALAVLSMNGLSLKDATLGDRPSPLLKFATIGVDRPTMRSSDPFLREIACLHGLSEKPRHHAVLATAFDPAEEITFDAIEQEHQSS